MGRLAKWFVIGAGAAILILALAAWLYLKGIYRFSYPDALVYPVRGIDVSHHQRAIDWRRVAAQNIRFVYLKASEGGDWTDPTFTANLAAARSAGLAVGAYHYFTLCASGPVQARNFIATAPDRHLLDLPPAIDLEYVGNCAARPDHGRLTRELRAFIAIVTAHYGKTPVIYSTQTFFEDYLDSDPAFRAYPLWVRNLFGEGGWSRGRTVIFRQFANHARLGGIDGSVDLDLFIGSKAQFDELLHR